MDWRVLARRSLTFPKSLHRPNRRNARLGRRDLRFRSFPFGRDFVAFVAATIHTLTGKLSRRQRRILREVAFLAQQRFDALVDFLFTLGIQQFFAGQKLFVQNNGIARLPVVKHFLRHIFRGIMLRVPAHAHRFRFDQNWAFARSRAIYRFFCGGVHRHHVVAVHDVTRNSVRLGAIRQILYRHLPFHRRGIRPLIIFQDQNEWRLLRRREIQPFVKNSRRASPITDPRHGHNLLAQITARHGHPGHHRN